MQAQRNLRVKKERFRKWAVRFLVGFFNDVVEVSHRLVRVDNQSEVNFTQDGTPAKTWTLEL